MADLDQLAMAMPHTTREEADGRPRYLVHGKLYCCHRGRRPDAVDPDTGQRIATRVVVVERVREDIDEAGEGVG